MKSTVNLAHRCTLSLALLGACAAPTPAERDADTLDALDGAGPSDVVPRTDAGDVRSQDDAASDEPAAPDVVAQDVARACDADGGLPSCDGACVDRSNDDANCGACGRACADNERCAAGRCLLGCHIDGTRYDAGALNASNPCQRCDPAQSIGSWSAVPDRTACGAGRFCAANACVAGCLIGGALIADGARDPSNECRACVASASSSAYSARSDGSPCGVAQFCTAGACGPTWHRSTPTGLTPVYGGSAASTLDGRVVLFGGVTSALVPIVQIYDPATNAFTRGPDAPHSPYRSCAVRARSGRIYVMGGQLSNGLPTASAAVFDPATNTFAAAPSMPGPGNEHACALGNDGRIYAFVTDNAPRPGDLFATSYTYILDPVANTWTTGAPMPTPRQLTTAVTLRDGRIVVSGGNRGFIFGALTQSNEIYNPATNTWSAAAPQPPLVHWNRSALRSDGRVVITGGAIAGGGLSTATYVYDPTLDRWDAGLPNVEPHYAGYMAATPDGRLYVLSGRASVTTLSNTVEALY